MTASPFVKHTNQRCDTTPVTTSKKKPAGAKLRLVDQPPTEPTPAIVYPTGEYTVVEKQPLTLLDQALLGLDPKPMSRAVDVALRVLRQVSGPRPPLLMPVTVNARAAGSAAVMEMRTRCQAITGETEGSRPPREVADEVLRAAAPFIQRDLINRIVADRLWMLGVISASAGSAMLGMGVAAAWAIASGSAWVAVVLFFAAAAVGFCTWQQISAVRGQTQRARSVAEVPLTGQKPDEAALTVDLATATGDGQMR